MKVVLASDRFPKNDNLKVLSFLYSYNNQLNLYFLEGEFKAGQVIVPEILAHIEQYKNKIDAHHVMLLYYKLGCLYFGCEDYESAIIYLNKIVQNKGLKMREDLLCFARVLNLVAHYEAGYDYHIDTHIRDTYKFLLKMDDLHEVQKSMITFIRKLGDIYPQELKLHFKQLHEELKQYEEDPYERRAFLYLDILSWLESKIENKPIAQIIKAKSLKSQRQHKPAITHL
jgi:tetratricopeptide (TPR) repeat protein